MLSFSLDRDFVIYNLIFFCWTFIWIIWRKKDLCQKLKEVNHYESCKWDKMSNQKHLIKISFFLHCILFIALIWFDVWLDPLFKCFDVDKDDNIEEESNEDKDDAAEDPDGKGSQSCGVRWGWGEGRVEHVYQDLRKGKLMDENCVSIQVEHSPVMLWEGVHNVQDGRRAGSGNSRRKQPQMYLTKFWTKYWVRFQMIFDW